VAEPVCCARVLGALATNSKVMNVTIDKNRVQLRLIGRSFSFESGVAQRKCAFRFSFKAMRGDLSQVSVLQLMGEGAVRGGMVFGLLNFPGLNDLDKPISSTFPSCGLFGVWHHRIHHSCGS